MLYSKLKGNVRAGVRYLTCCHAPEQVEVPKDNRHRDRPIVQDIFAALDKFLGSRQSKLSY